MNRLGTTITSGTAMLLVTACTETTSTTKPAAAVSANVEIRADGPHLVGSSVVNAPGLPLGHAPARGRILAQGQKLATGECGGYVSPEFRAPKEGELRRIFTIAQADTTTCAAVFLLGDWQPMEAPGQHYDTRTVVSRISQSSSLRTIISSMRSMAQQCEQWDQIAFRQYEAWIAYWPAGTKVLHDILSITWGYNGDYVNGATLTHSVGVDSPTWTRDLMDQGGYYDPPSPPPCPDMALVWSFSGAFRNCPGGGVNLMRIGSVWPYRNIVRGFDTGLSNGDQPAFITNANGTTPCPVTVVTFWGPTQGA